MSNNTTCRLCGKPLSSFDRSGRSICKVYCSEKCNKAWWKAKTSKTTHRPAEVNCNRCGKIFTTRTTGHKYCSAECRKQHQAIVPVDRSLPTGTVGAAVELIISAKLMLDGWHVFRALSPCCFCDLVAIRNGETRLLEARTGHRLQSGLLSFPNKTHPGSTEFAVYIAEENQVVFVPIPLARCAV